MTKTNFQTMVPHLQNKLVEIRRHLHEYPELSRQEFQTSVYIRELLEDADISILPSSLETGVIAEIKGNGPVIALRADIDALPITEETNLPYASKNLGKMHACGHDFHTASILGAAYLLKQKETHLKGTVRFIFQAAEENSSGAKDVIKAGLLNDVTAIFGLHNKPDLSVGTIGITEGPLMASVDRFEIQIDGKGTHAAAPHRGIDPIVTASHIILALQSIVSRSINPLHSAVISVTNLHARNTWNVIPGTVTLEGTVRTFQDDVRNTIPEKIRQIIQGVASALGGIASLHWYPGPPSIQNDSLLTELCQNAATLNGLSIVDPQPSMAGEDFAYYQREVPGFFVFMGTSGTEEWHHPSFTLDERALSITAHYFATLAEKALLGLSKSNDFHSS
ncbi:M20 peptidase aminoacylase family protein [Ectobacillus sp. sgz5001026]|uniref:M20 peptidase aminoacylase family protein n=1 Tax=Ectobacillus sp. sgz5001026 TaxID=3242473 RepID=UPI0036D3535F